jgi:hypothetical protein
MSSFLPTDPDYAPRLKRAFRRLEVLVLLGFLALGAFLYWQGRQYRLALHDIQRPVVVLRDIKFLPVHRADGALSWQFVAYWENAGITGARAAQSDVHYWTGPVTPGFSRMKPNDFLSEQFDLGPRETINRPYFSIPAEAMAAAKETPDYLIIWGGAIYHEARPGGGPHMTRFCYVVTGVGGDPANPAVPLDVRTNWCREGNCTDDDCLTQGYTMTPPATPSSG